MALGSIVARTVSGDNQSAEANQRVSDPLVVEAMRGGSPAQNEAVRFHVSEGGGKIGATPGQLGTVLEARTGPDGRATLPVWVLGASGGQRVVARGGTPPLTSVSFRATVVPPRRVLEIVAGPTLPPDHLESGSDSGSGVEVGPLVVRLRRGSAPIVGETVTFAVTRGMGRIGGPGGIGPTFVTRTGADGRATCPNWQLGELGPQAVVARVGQPEPASVVFEATATDPGKFPQ